MANQIMRITLKAYDHKLIDQAAKEIIDAVKGTNVKVSGPVPMPTKVEKVTILRAVHKYKDSREQFEQRTHKRLIDMSLMNICSVLPPRPMKLLNLRPVSVCVKVE